MIKRINDDNYKKMGYDNNTEWIEALILSMRSLAIEDY